MTRVFLNLFGNGFYATTKRQRNGAAPGFRPTLKVTTRDLGDAVEVRVHDKGIEIDGLPVATAAARVQQHALDDAVGAAPMFNNFFQIAGQHLDCLVDFGTRVVVELSNHRSRRVLYLIQQLNREPGEVVDEIERVFDLVGDAGGQLAECSHFLRVDQICLGRLQFAQGRLGGVARRSELFLGRLRSVMSL
jgi:hypothetical protein